MDSVGMNGQTVAVKAKLERLNQVDELSSGLSLRTTEIKNLVQALLAQIQQGNSEARLEFGIPYPVKVIYSDPNYVVSTENGQKLVELSPKDRGLRDEKIQSYVSNPDFNVVFEKAQRTNNSSSREFEWVPEDINALFALESPKKRSSKKTDQEPSFLQTVVGAVLVAAICFGLWKLVAYGRNWWQGRTVTPLSR